MTSKLYNVDLETGECVEERTVEYERMSLDDFIKELQEAAKGLDNPHIDIEVEPQRDWGVAQICIVGKRTLTEAEKQKEKADRARQQRYLEHMRAFKG